MLINHFDNRVARSTFVVLSDPVDRVLIYSEDDNLYAGRGTHIKVRCLPNTIYFVVLQVDDQIVVRSFTLESARRFETAVVDIFVDLIEGTLCAYNKHIRYYWNGCSHVD